MVTMRGIRHIGQCVVTVVVSLALVASALGITASASGAATPDAPFDASRFFAWGDRAVETLDLGAYLALSEVHQTASGSGVTIAILDNGFDTTHPSFTQGRTVPGYDHVDGDRDPSESPNGVDEDGDGLVDEALGHGTQVLDVISQVAPTASILPIRVLDAEGLGTTASVVAGIETARDRGADVINISFGSATDLPGVREAIDSLPSSVVVVAAAGNTSDERKQFPAANPNVTAVAAYDPATRGVADFSNMGSWVDVSAPGVGIAPGTPRVGQGADSDLWSGSSFATPVVAAQYALLRQLRPYDSAAELRLLILDTAYREKAIRRTSRGLIDISRSLTGQRTVKCVSNKGALTVSAASSAAKVHIRKNNSFLTTVTDADLTDNTIDYTDEVRNDGDNYTVVLKMDGRTSTATCLDAQGPPTGCDVLPWTMELTVIGSDADVFVVYLDGQTTPYVILSRDEGSSSTDRWGRRPYVRFFNAALPTGSMDHIEVAALGDPSRVMCSRR